MERDETQTTGTTPAAPSQGEPSGPPAKRDDARPEPKPSTSADGGGSSDATTGAASDGGGGAGNGGNGGGGGLGPDGQPRKRRRRGKRGGKRHRKKPAADKVPAPNGEGGDGAASDATSSPKPARAKTSRASDAPKADGAAKEDTAKADTAKADGPASEDKPARARTRSSSKPRTPRAPKADTGDDAKPGAKAASTDDAKPEAAEDQAPAAADGEGPKKRRRRGKRGGRGRKSTAAGGDGQKQPAQASDTGDAKEKKPAAKAKPDRSGGSTRLKARQLRKDQQRSRGRRPRRLTEDDAARLRGGDKVMLVHEHDDRTQIAVLEEGTLIEHYVARKGERTTMAGNIFLGKVQNVLPSMEAAFVDFGRGRNGVLYAGEVNYSAEDLEGEAPRIEKVLKSGQPLMVQVTKDPIGNKGARLTTQISLAGRYMVLAPEQQLTGISRRLADKERARLRTILRDIRPNGHGVIVRTAAEGASREALERDLQNLLKTWETVQKQAKKAKAPALLYAEPELVSRVVRDIFSGETKQIVVDDRPTFDDIRGYLEETGPDEIEKLTLHEGPLPLFETYRVTEQLHKALERKVWLPSGGSLVIDRTEAMTVIDVNTGKFTGKGSNLEETVFKNNIEAADEVARQLRLRDIGGIIVVDFIDMIDPNNQKELLRTLKRALSKDKTRSQVFDVTNLGLVEMTRKRVSEGLLEAFSEPCPNCEGRGIVMTHEID